jgi:hypothetical protein
VELAKYFEWTVRDLARAADWTKAALRQVEAVAPGPYRDARLADLHHRLSRLERKMAETPKSDLEPSL